MKPLSRLKIIDDWNEPSLEFALRKAFQEGREKELVPLLHFLPEPKKALYRELWKKLREEREKNRV